MEEKFDHLKIEDKIRLNQVLRSRKVLGKGKYSGSFKNGRYELHLEDLSQIETLASMVTADVEPDSSDEENQQEQRSPKKNKTADFGIRTKYSERDMQIFFIVYENQSKKNIKEAANQVNVNLGTARSWLKKFPSGDPKTKVVSRKLKLGQQHTDYILELFETLCKENKLMQTNYVITKLESEFAPLKVSPSTLYRHFHAMGLSFKKVVHEVADRNKPETIEKRATWISYMKKHSIDYMENCIFIDEAAFDENLTLSHSWSYIGKPVNVKTAKIRAPTFTVIGAISSRCIINVAIKTPRPKGSKKKTFTASDMHDATETISTKRTQLFNSTYSSGTSIENQMMKGLNEPSSTSLGTTKDHFLYFFWNVLESLKNQAQDKDLCFILDNSRIQNNSEVKDMVNVANDSFGTRFRVVFLPPYSPQLNPIELFWSLLKISFRDTTGSDIPVRVSLALEKISVKALKSMVKHSIKFFPMCEQREPLINL